MPEATTTTKEYLDERVADLSAALSEPDAELRTAVAVCTILGLTFAATSSSSMHRPGPANRPRIVAGQLVVGDPNEAPTPGSPTT